MEKSVLVANIKLQERMLESEVETFKKYSNSEELQLSYKSQMRIILEIRRRVALKNNEIEFANYIKEIIDKQTNEIHMLNKAYSKKLLEKELEKLTFHQKVSILGYVRENYYDENNDPYEILQDEVKQILKKHTIEEADKMLEKYNWKLKNIKEIPINKVYQVINNQELALDMLYASEEI